MYGSGLHTPFFYLPYIRPGLINEPAQPQHAGMKQNYAKNPKRNDYKRYRAY